MTSKREIPCTIMRGGTSKGIFIMKENLPQDPSLKDKVILALFGSPDMRQIDGLGGADSLTSKLAIISCSRDKGIDIEYTFGAVGIAEPFVDYSANCGNISSAVGPFAIEKGLVPPVGPFTTVKILNTNTQRMIHAKVPVKEGKVVTVGDFWVDGVPTPGAEIKLTFFDPGGPFTGKLLPTEKERDWIKITGKKIPITIIDAGNPTAFVSARDLSLKGIELPDEINAAKHLLGLLEEIRQEVAHMTRIGLSPDGRVSPSVPKVAVVGSPESYEGINRKKVGAHEINLVSRITAMRKIHKAYPVTGAIPTAAAAKIEGSVVHEVVQNLAGNEVRIGHPSGIMRVETRLRKDGSQFIFESCTIGRTARLLMDGIAYVPEHIPLGAS